MTGRRLAAWIGSLLVLLALAGCVAPGSSPPPLAVAETRPPEDHLIAADGAMLPLRGWLPRDPPRAVLLALHGFNEYSNFIGDAAAFFAKNGIATYAYDQRGFGLAPERGHWPGEETLIADLRTAVTTLKSRHPGTPLYLLGESMGGAVVLAALATDEPPAIAGAIVSAPAVWGRSAMPWYQTTLLWLAAHTFPSGQLTGRGLGVLASDNLEMLRGLGRDPLVIKRTRIDAIYGLVNLMDRALAAAPAIRDRILILYGGNDQLIPPETIDNLLARMPPAAAGDQRYLFYPKGYHLLLRDLDAEVAWRDILAWIDHADARPPSVAHRRVGPNNDGARAMLADGESFALRSAQRQQPFLSSHP